MSVRRKILTEVLAEITGAVSDLCKETRGLDKMGPRAAERAIALLRHALADLKRAGTEMEMAANGD